jgi:hypothetical protein
MKVTARRMFNSTVGCPELSRRNHYPKRYSIPVFDAGETHAMTRANWRDEKAAHDRSDLITPT